MQNLHVHATINIRYQVPGVIILNTQFPDRMAVDLFSEIHMKSRSTQAYRVDAFWVIVTWYNIPLFSLIQMLKFVLHILNLK